MMMTFLSFGLSFVVIVYIFFFVNALNAHFTVSRPSLALVH